MNHQNLLIENKNLKKHNKELLAKLREYDIIGTQKENQDPRSKSKSITDGLEVEFVTGSGKTFAVAKTSSASSSPLISVTSVESAPRIRDRWEMDLSPGT